MSIGSIHSSPPSPLELPLDLSVKHSKADGVENPLDLSVASKLSPGSSVSMAGTNLLGAETNVPRSVSPVPSIKDLPLIFEQSTSLLLPKKVEQSKQSRFVKVLFYSESSHPSTSKAACSSPLILLSDDEQEMDCESSSFSVSTVSVNLAEVPSTSRGIAPQKKEHQCPTCAKVFTTLTRLNRHMGIHTGEKNHICEKCEKSFQQKSTLTRHNRTHTGEKPHKCSLCAMAFCQSGQLQVHQRVHTGEKSFRCTNCSKVYGAKVDLTNHKKKCGGTN